MPVPEITGSRIAAVSQNVSDFEGALRSNVVAQRVASETGLPAQRIQSGVGTEQLAAGAVVEVSFTSSDRFAARAVVDAVSTQALRVLMEAKLAPIEQAHTRAVTALETVRQEYQDFLTENEISDPDEFFAQQARIAQDYLEAIQAAEAEGNTDRATELRAERAGFMAGLAPLQVEYRVLQQTLTSAVQFEREANAQLVSAEAAVEAVQDEGTVPVSDPVPVPRLGLILRRLLVAVVVATSLGIGLVILLELTTSRVAPPRAVPAGATTPQGAVVGEHPAQPGQVSVAEGNGRSSKRARPRTRSRNRR